MSDNFLEQLDRLPDYLGNHVFITLVALLVGIAFSLPLAVLVARWKAARWPALTTAGVIQTIPSLALLALMVPLLGAFGFWPAVTALTLYSILPILRNTVTGLSGVDPALIEAARGMGMTRNQQLFRVELPLAAPIIIAGVRTATVWVVGIATLATPVGQTSLGNYIFSGLQTRNWTAVLFGCVAAALLAIVLDLMIGALEAAARNRSRWQAIGVSVLLVGFLGAALAAPLYGGIMERGGRTVASEDRADHPPDDYIVRIGAKTFTEQYILAAALEAAIQDAGLRTRRTESLGSTVIFDALVNGDIDVYIDYTGTIWANYMGREDILPAWATMDRVSGWLVRETGARNLGALGFENTYALAMRRDRAEELGIRTIDDLLEHTPQMRIGGDYEFFQRSDWLRARDTYDLRFSNIVSYDSTFMYQAVRDGEVEVIAAFSTDGRIAAYDLVVLEDPRQAFPPYDAIILLSSRVASWPRLVEALVPLVGSFDDATMRLANKSVDLDGQTPLMAGRALVDPGLAGVR
jgi:osmoprotectant transport system permease protein